METKRKNAVVLLSGGMDSAVCLAVARKQYKCYLLTFDYGQRHGVEIEHASALAGADEEHRIVSICTTPHGPGLFGKSSLLGDGKVEEEAVPTGTIPSTWIPCRNLIFLSIAAAYAVSVDAEVIFTGVNDVDFSGYPDCRGTFLQAAEEAIREALGNTKMRIHVPLIHLSKANIVRRGVELGVDFKRTWSCYAPMDGSACGVCPSCRLRKKGFEEANVKDPTIYAGERSG